MITLEANTARGFAPDSRTFFNFIRNLTMQGTFGDPYYGGNADGTGWKMIGFPGIKLEVPASEQAVNVTPRPGRKSAYDYEISSRRAPPPKRASRKAAAPWKQLGSRRRTSSSSGSAPRAAWRRCPSLEPASTSSGSTPEPRYWGGDYPSDEIKLEIRREHSRKLLNDVPTVRDTAAQTARIDTAPGLTMNGVGGSTIHYNCQSWRFKPWDFKAHSDTVQKYGASAVPAGSALADWPLSYEDLEPYYDKVEYTIGVSGKAGNLRGQIDPAGQHLRGAAIARVPQPAAAHRRVAEPADRLREASRLEPVHGSDLGELARVSRPAGLHLLRVLQRHRLPQRREGLDRRDLDPRRGGDQEASRHLARPRDQNRDGRQRARHRSRLPQERQAVLPAGGGRLPVELHLRERPPAPALGSRSFPGGLSNNHGQVGKYFTTQASSVAWGLFPGQRFNRWYGQGSQALHVEEYGDRRFDHKGLGFIGGGQMDGRCAYKPIQMVGFASDYPRLRRRWGSEWKSWVMQNVDSIGRIGSSMDTTIYEEDKLDLDPGLKDTLGFPRLRVTLRRPFRSNEQQLSNFMQEKMKTWLVEAGATETWEASGSSLSFIGVHAYGGTRMGNDPETSVTNKLVHLPRMPEPRHRRSVELPDDEPPPPHGDASGARLAHRRVHREELEVDHDVATVRWMTNVSPSRLRTDGRTSSSSRKASPRRMLYEIVRGQPNDAEWPDGTGEWLSLAQGEVWVRLEAIAEVAVVDYPEDPLSDIGYNY